MRYGDAYTVLGSRLRRLAVVLTGMTTRKRRAGGEDPLNPGASKRSNREYPACLPEGTESFRLRFATFTSGAGGIDLVARESFRVWPRRRDVGKAGGIKDTNE